MSSNAVVPEIAVAKARTDIELRNFFKDELKEVQSEKIYFHQVDAS